MIFKKSFFQFRLSILGWLLIGGATLSSPALPNFDLAEKAFQSKIFNFAIINYEKALVEERSSDKKETARYRLAESYYQIEEWDEALKNTQEYLKDYPEGRWFFEVSYLQGLIFLKKQDYLAVQNILETLIKDFPEHDEIYKLIFTLAEVYQDLGNYDKAISSLTRPMGKYDNDRDYLKARIHYQNQNYQIALGEIQKVKKEELQVFSLDEAVDLHVEIYLKIQNYSDALKVIEEYFYRLQNTEYKSKFLFYQSHIFFLQGDYTRAIVHYKRYLDKVKESSYRNDVIFFLGLSYYRIEQPIIALEYISRLEVPEIEATLTAEGKARKDKLAYLIYQSLGRQEKQVEYLDRLIFPGSPEELFAVREKIKWLAQKNDQDPTGEKVSMQMEAYLSRYDKLESDPRERANFYNQLAEIYFKNNNSTLNVFFSQRAYSNFTDKTYLLGLADRLSASGDHQQAVKIYESLLLQSEGYEKRYIQDALGYALFQEGDYRRSIEHYEKNLEAEEVAFRASAWFYVAENYRLLQDYKQSEKYFLLFLKTFPDDPRAALSNLNLGFIHYYGTKDYRKALIYLDEAYWIVESDPALEEGQVGGESIKNNIFQLRFRCYLDLGEEKNAVEQLGLISKRDAPDLYYGNLLILAKFYFNQQDYARSLNQYYEIINSENGDSRPSDEVLEIAYFERVLIKLKEDSGREAYFYLLKLEQRFPDSKLVREGFLSVGDYYYSKQRWLSVETVYSEFERYARTPEDRIYALYYLGIARQQLGKEEEAYLNFLTIKEIGQAEGIYDNFYYDTLFELGINEFENKRLSEARENFQEIAERSPSQDLRDKARKNLDIIETMEDPNPYSGLKTVEEISKKINTVSAQSLKDQGYYLIAKLYFEAGDYQQSYEMTRKIVSPSRYSDDALILGLKALLSLEDFEEVYAYGMENYFRSDFNLVGDKKEFFYYSLAYASKKLDRRADYEKFLQFLRKEFPHSEYLQTQK